MKPILAVLVLLAAGLGLVSCGLEDLTGNNGDEPVRLRFLHFKYAEIPSSMDDETAIRLMRTQLDNSLRSNATEHWFPMNDTLDNPWGGGQVAINRLIITQPGSTHNGGTRLLGGQNSETHPFQPHRPSSLLIDAVGVTAAGRTGSAGEFELRFNENELVIGGRSSQSDFLEFTLDTYHQENSYGIGRFMFIARNLNDASDRRRWAIFDGEYALQKGN